MSKVNIKINGCPVEAAAGSTVLEAARAAGIDIPTLCHHPALENVGACRMCLVEIDKVPALHPACTYPVSEGMEVQTESERVVEMRKFVLEMLFSERNHYCMYCEMSGDCELQSLAYRYKMDHWSFTSPGERLPTDGSRAAFIMDHNRCILCRRCLRACSELVANHTLGLKYRGSKTMISADLDVPFGESSCVSCGTCLQVCPTGALVDRRSAYLGREVQVERTRSACTFCSVGCDTQIVTREGHVLRVEGPWDGHNGGILCARGRFDMFQDKRERITQPLVRRKGALIKTTWDEALDEIAAKIKHAPAGAVKAWTTGNALSETMDRLKGIFGDRLGVLEPLLETGGLPTGGDLADLDGAPCILVAGADPLSEHRVLGYRIKRARDKGAEVIVASDTPTPLDVFAQRKFTLAEIAQAVQICRGSGAPVVVYGRALDAGAAAAIAELGRLAKYIALEAATNARHARELGLANGLATDGVAVAFFEMGDIAAGEKMAEKCRKAEFVAAQAAYRTPVTDAADVVLPAPIWSERSGTFTNLAGREMKVNAATRPPAGILSEVETLAQLAARL